MASPFPHNATLIFQVPIGDSQIDALGNLIADTETVQVEAYLVQQSRRQQPTSDDATDQNAVPFKGRWISPETPPAGLQPGAKADAIIGNLAGTFVLGASAGSPFAAVDAALGFPLEGTLYNRVVWGEGS